MRTVSIFRNNRNQAIRLPKDYEFPGVTELEIDRKGDTILLRPVRPSWMSFREEPHSDADFLVERSDLMDEERFALESAKKTRRR